MCNGDVNKGMNETKWDNGSLDSATKKDWLLKHNFLKL